MSGSGSLAFDASGNPHISYNDNTNNILDGDLKYASNVGGSWTTETVDSAGDVGYYNSLAFDASGNPHISYFDNTNKDLKYASKIGANPWTTETVDSTGDVGSQNSLAFDASGNPHIAYLDETNWNLMYASRVGANPWTFEIITGVLPLAQIGFGPRSLAIDANGNPHLSFCQNYALGYATKDGANPWTGVWVDNIGLTGTYNSMALDLGGNPHISYMDVTNRDLKYASNVGGTWTTETVDSAGEVGTGSSLAFDASGNPHISYLDLTNQDLKYASKVGATWTTETIFSTGNVGWSSSLAFDASGNPHISYLDVTNDPLNALMYASFGSETVVTGNSGQSGNNAEVNAATKTTTNTINMQNTGAPIGVLVLALLMVLAGLIIPMKK
jgi:hypothetical protein